MPSYEVLRPASLLAGLGDDQLHRLWDAGKRVQTKAGDAVIREGESGTSMFILLEGTVEISQVLVLRMGSSAITEKEKTLIRLEGSMRPCFGEMALLEDAERSATVTCVTDCEVFEIDRGPFFKLIEDDPRMGVAILRNMAVVVSSRLRKANRDVLKLTTALSLAVSS